MAKARTIDTIETAMLADKESRTALSGLTSTSKTSRWRSLIRAFATSQNLHESAFEGFAGEIEERALEIQPGIPRWYAAESLVFQYGDTLEYINGNLTYQTVDQSKQIIKLAAADVENGFLVLKVAGLNGDGTARPLNNMEFTAFKAYWADKKFACTPLAFVSQFGDVARLTYRIGVDATVIDPDTGQLLTDANVYPVEDAINAFLREFQSERFNGTFRLAELTDIIQAVPGVVNPIAEDVRIKPSGGAFVDVIASDNDEYLTRSGFIVHDTSSGNGLRDLLNYYNA